nr:transposase [Azoarcus taiwanensis]
MVVAKALAADKFAAWCAELPPGCLVALEACGGAHHWARKLRGYGLDARLIAGHFVTPYRMAGKGVKGKRIFPSVVIQISPPGWVCSSNERTSPDLSFSLRR